MSEKKNSGRKVILMDTSSFIEFLNNDYSHYDFAELKELTDSGFLFAITPYSLYEYLIKVEDDNISNIAHKICFNTDFWVLNVNHIFEDYEGYLDGRSFVFRFGMHANDVLLFHKSMEELKEKVYKTLSPKLYLISQTIAILWIMFTEADANGILNQDTHFKIEYIDEHFLEQHKKRCDLLLGLEFEKDDIKYRIADNILRLSFEMIALSNVEMYLWKNSVKVDNDEYNRLIFEEIDRIEVVANSIPLYEIRKRFEKAMKDRFSIDELEEHLLNGMKLRLLKDSYKMIIDKAFSKEGLHKKETNNDIIDFTNMCLIEAFAGIPVAFLISEKKWLKYIIHSTDMSLKMTQEYIDKYMNPDYLEVIKRN